MSFNRYPQLVTWFDEGLTGAIFYVPGGRHIVLNEFPRLMKLKRLQSSASVDVTVLRTFFLLMHPKVLKVSEETSSSLPEQLLGKGERLPCLCTITIKVPPKFSLERDCVYMPPLKLLRQGWRHLAP